MSARLELIVGPMFSGKTERLIAALHRKRYSRKRIQILKPSLDTRTEDFVASRAMNEDGTTRVTEKLPATLIESENDFLTATAGDAYDVLAVDEAQFFPLDKPLKDSLGWFGRGIRDLLRRRKSDPLHIIVAGLDMDAAENPFGPMPGLLAMANKVEKITAVCMNCGADDAHLSHRLTSWELGTIAVGDAKEYRALCRACFTPPPSQ